jgi:hypothetical protein
MTIACPSHPHSMVVTSVTIRIMHTEYLQERFTC